MYSPVVCAGGVCKAVIEKIRELVKIREQRKLNFMISVDGGVNSETIGSVIEAGADVVVSGSAFFNGQLKWENFDK